MPAQPKLRSLGLSFIPDLPLGVVSEFLRNKAPQVEVLTLLGTSPELVRSQRASVALHGQLIRPLCTPTEGSDTACDAQIPTRLRVIELATALLSKLGTGAGSWRIVRSKGGRAWYVDTASGWVAEEGGALLRRDLQKGHPWKRAIEILAEANGNVSSGIGWHARKMEVSAPCVAAVFVAVQLFRTVADDSRLYRFCMATAFLDEKTAFMAQCLLPIRDRVEGNEIPPADWIWVKIENKNKKKKVYCGEPCHG
jgi:hypothetical protein